MTHRARKAFTLVEMMVVVTLVAVLVALLLPAASNAKRTAYSAICMSNLRQLQAATINYAVSNAQQIPAYDVGYKVFRTYYNMIAGGYLPAKFAPHPYRSGEWAWQTNMLLCPVEAFRGQPGAPARVLMTAKSKNGFTFNDVVVLNNDILNGLRTTASNSYDDGALGSLLSNYSLNGETVSNGSGWDPITVSPYPFACYRSNPNDGTPGTSWPQNGKLTRLEAITRPDNTFGIADGAGRPRPPSSAETSTAARASGTSRRST